MTKELGEITGQSISDDVVDGLMVTDSGKAIVNVENICRILSRVESFESQIRFDNWTGKLYIYDHDEDDWRDFSDGDYIDLQCRLSQVLPEFARVTKALVIDALTRFMGNNKEDTAIDYVRSLTWDKEDRIGKMMHLGYGTPDDEYHSAVGSNFMKGMAARIVEPGVKFDTVLCIEGVQGLGKSTSLELLAGDMNHLETMVDPENKDFLMQMRGNLIVEFTEGVIIRKKDAENMKGFVSKNEDTFRSPYGIVTNTVKRRCVFAMTTNSDEYLKDTTGNRRFIPIVAQKIDKEWIKENRDQLFAEALYRREVMKETLYEYPDDVLEHQENKVVRSEHYDLIQSWCLNPYEVHEDQKQFVKQMDINGGFTVLDVWMHCLENSKGAIQGFRGNEIAGVLKSIGFEKRRVMVDGATKSRWYRIEPMTLDEE